MATIFDNVNGTLPQGWKWSRLGDVVDFLDHRRVPVSSEERVRRIGEKKPSDLYPYYGANGQAGWIDDYLFDEPLILLAEDGGNFGSRSRPIAYAASGKFWVNNHAHVLRPRKELIDFTYCLLSLSIRPDVGKMVSGSTRGKLNAATAMKIPIPLPPLAEQKRIATKLNRELELIKSADHAAEEQLGGVRALSAAYMRNLFESPEARKWPIRSLRDLCVDNGQYGTSTRADASPTNGIPVLGMWNINEGALRWDKLSFISREAAELEKYQLRRGDLLFNRTNSVELVGKTAVFEDSGEAIFASYLIRFRTKESEADPRYVSAYVNSKYARRFINENLTRAVGQANISATTINKLPIPVPPLQRQKEIIAALSAQRSQIRNMTNAIQETLKTLQSMQVAILQRAFMGRI